MHDAIRVQNTYTKSICRAFCVRGDVCKMYLLNGIIIVNTGFLVYARSLSSVCICIYYAYVTCTIATADDGNENC